MFEQMVKAHHKSEMELYILKTFSSRKFFIEIN